MVVTTSSAMSASWTHRIWQDLQPAPGRLGKTLRIVLASVLALILMLVWQMPFIQVGLYFIFLVARDSPAVSLRSSIISLVTVLSAIAVELAVVILTDNDPMARLLSVAIVTYIAGSIVVASNLPALGSTWGLIYCTVISLWELHAPADTLVKGSLWLVATFTVALACAVGVEYVFGNRHPVEELQEQRRIRYSALYQMFTLFAERAAPEKRFEAASVVSRLAITGQGGMMELYNAIVDRNLDTGTLPMGSRVRITMLAQLLDVSAAFGMQNDVSDDPEFLRRCALIAEQCRELDPVIIPNAETHLDSNQSTAYTLLDRVENVLHALLSMPTDNTAGRNKELVALPSKKVSFFIPGAMRSKETVAFGLKISFCATLCYIIYHAVDWPGISTSVITVIVTGLSSSAAIKQKLALRFVGSAIGGLILGLGATTFLFPHMDSITSLIVLVSFVAFISAWCASGPKFNYVGLQIAFSFYLVAFEGFSAPTELAPARDRLIGIVIALVIMWFVFDQIWPVRTVTVMRRALSSIVRIGADLFQLTATREDHADLLLNADVLRDRVGKTVANLRTLNDTLNYEFGVDKELHLQSGERMLRAALTGAALFWNQFALLHNELDADFLTEPGLVEMRIKIAQHMSTMADSVVSKKPFSIMRADALVVESLLQSPRYGEYTRYTVARYQELQTTVLSLATMA
jgi:multidrug resistance protein MdtO